MSACQCDAIEAIRQLWKGDVRLQSLIPVTSDASNGVWEQGNAREPVLPYVILSDQGEADRQSTADSHLVVKPVRVRIHTRTKEEGARVRLALRQVLNKCFSGVCLDGGSVIFGRVVNLPSGYSAKGVYTTQLQLRLLIQEEGSP